MDVHHVDEGDADSEHSKELDYGEGLDVDEVHDTSPGTGGWCDAVLLSSSPPNPNEIVTTSHFWIKDPVSVSPRTPSPENPKLFFEEWRILASGREISQWQTSCIPVLEATEASSPSSLILD